MPKREPDLKTGKIGQGAPGPGRPPGLENKTTRLLKDAILKAATDAGGGDMSVYLTEQAQKNPNAFLSLLGKVLPMQVTGADGGAVEVSVITRRIVDPKVG